MTKPKPPPLPGLDTLLEEQALELAALRATRGNHRAMEDERTRKQYRLGPENPDGSLPIDVADRGTDNWREWETCRNVELAQERIKQLRADDTKFCGAVTTPHNGGKPGP